MKFLLIANNDYDGIGQHVLRTNFYLNKKKNKSKILVLHKTTNDKNVFVVKRLIFFRLFSFLLNFIKKNFKDLFSFGNSTISYGSIKKYVEDSDILIIFSLHSILPNVSHIIFFKSSIDFDEVIQIDIFFGL